MAFGLHIWHGDLIRPHLVGQVHGQGHKSKFKVTGGNVPFWLKVKVKLGKTVLATYLKSRPELEIV